MVCIFTTQGAYYHNKDHPHGQDNHAVARIQILTIIFVEKNSIDPVCFYLLLITPQCLVLNCADFCQRLKMMMGGNLTDCSRKSTRHQALSVNEPF